MLMPTGGNNMDAIKERISRLEVVVGVPQVD